MDVYSGVARLAKTVWASEVRAPGTRPTTAVMICHPTANFLGHYALPGLAARGFAGIGLTTRYVGNDTSLLMENCLLDIGSMVAHLRSVGYEQIVLVGNSGGASIVPYYQAQAESPSVTDPPGGGPDLTQAGLVPADAIGMLNAHPSRALVCAEWLDPAILDEHQPFERDPSLDMYDADNGPPFSAEFIERYRAAQLERNRRISRWAEGQLRTFSSSSHLPAGLDDFAFVVHGTSADLRFLDGAIDPSDRQVGATLWGPPAMANYLPAGVGRCSTVRSWLNQWSVDHHDRRLVALAAGGSVPGPGAEPDGGHVRAGSPWSGDVRRGGEGRSRDHRDQGRDPLLRGSARRARHRPRCPRRMGRAGMSELRG